FTTLLRSLRGAPVGQEEAGGRRRHRPPVVVHPAAQVARVGQGAGAGAARYLGLGDPSPEGAVPVALGHDELAEPSVVRAVGLDGADGELVGPAAARVAGRGAGPGVAPGDEVGPPAVGGPAADRKSVV